MHKLNQLEKIIEERISSLKEEKTIATNVRSNPMYISDRRDEIRFLQWATRIILWDLDRAKDKQQRPQFGMNKMLLELEDIMKFENMLHEKIQEREIEQEESYSLRESDILMHEIETLKCILGYMTKLKYSDQTQTKEIIGTNNNNFQYSKCLSGQLNKVQDAESKISA